MIPDELISWIQQSATQGMTFSQTVLQLSINFGYSIPVAKKIVSTTLLRPGQAHENVYQPVPNIPEICTRERRNVLALTGATASLSYEQYFPRIVVMDDFVSPAECAALCEQGSALLAPAEVIERGVLSEQVTSRSSFTARFSAPHSALVARIESRIAELVDWPSANTEPLQIQRYLTGQHFIPHFDFFEPVGKPDPFVLAGGQRLATLIVYLRGPDSGGATYFANLGLRIAPRSGRALFFSYPTASVGNGTMHSGETVEGGEKWILTKWFRQHSVGLQAM